MLFTGIIETQLPVATFHSLRILIAGQLCAPGTEIFQHRMLWYGGWGRRHPSPPPPCTALTCSSPPLPRESKRRPLVRVIADSVSRGGPAYVNIFRAPMRALKFKPSSARLSPLLNTPSLFLRLWFRHKTGTAGVPFSIHARF